MNEISNEKEIVKNSEQKITQVIIYLLYSLGPLTGNVILVLFGILSKEFNVSPSLVAIAIPTFMFPFAIIQLFSGALSDIKGRFPIIIFGLILFSLSMTVAFFSISLPLYLLANLLGGVGFGFVNPVLIALMTDISYGQEIPKRMGFLGAVANLGVGLGPLVAGQISLINWRLLYLIFLIITIIGIIIIIRIKGSRKINRNKRKFQIFLNHLKSELKNLGTILMILSAFLIAFTYLAVIIWTSREFTSKIPESISGLLIGSVGIIGSLTGIFIGTIIKKKGLQYAIIIGIFDFFFGLAILLIIGDITNLEFIGYIIIGLMLIGIAGGSLFPSVIYYSQIQSRKKRGALAGLATAGQFIGIALVPIAYEPLFNIGGISSIYLGILILGFVLLIILILLYQESKKSTKKEINSVEKIE